MNAMAIPAEAETAKPETANDRFKRSFESWLWGSMIAATIFHFMLFQFWPTQTAADISFTAEDLEVIDLLPEIEIPPPPEAISRPATPVMALREIDQDITIAPTTFADNPVEALPPPPTDDGAVDLSANPVFTPYTVHPEIKNRGEVRAALMREYPPALRDARIGGEVVVWFYVSDAGRVLHSEVDRSSGREDLDQAALRVADVLQFNPAIRNRPGDIPNAALPIPNEPVAVWIQLPITFDVQGR